MTITEQAKIVLQLVAERDMDGYTLALKSGLNQGDLEVAVRFLISNGLLRVKGETSGPKLMESWFQAPSGVLRAIFAQPSGLSL
jgi:hypothetical protein